MSTIKAMLLSVITYGSENIGSIAEIDNTNISDNITDIGQYLEAILKNFEEFHIKYRDIHEELAGLKHTDEDVRKLYSKITAEGVQTDTYRHRQAASQDHTREVISQDTVIKLQQFFTNDR